MNNFPVWPFVLGCALLLGITVTVIPGDGNLRFWGLGLAALVFPVLPLVGGYLLRRRQSLNDRAKPQA